MLNKTCKLVKVNVTISKIIISICLICLLSGLDYMEHLPMQVPVKGTCGNIKYFLNPVIVVVAVRNEL